MRSPDAIARACEGEPDIETPGTPSPRALASRNVKNVDVRDVQGVDPVSLISHEKVLVTVPALKQFEEALA